VKFPSKPSIPFRAFSVFPITRGICSSLDVGPITEADYLNVVIFPEKFNGLYAHLDRPHSEIAPVHLDFLLSGSALLGDNRSSS
jgi:hypothetical protein